MTDDDSIFLSQEQKEVLVSIISARATPKGIVTRTKIILLKAEGKSTYFITNHLKITWKMVQRWVKRWNEIVFPENKYNMKTFIQESLKDRPRSGRKPIFTEEQKLQIINVACRSPQNYGLVATHWTVRSLAKQIQVLKIAPTISKSKISVFLKSNGVKTA